MKHPLRPVPPSFRALRFGLLLGLFLLLPAFPSYGQNTDLILAKFHADWCPSCQRWDSVHPGFQELKEYAEREGIRVLTLDLTDEATTGEASRLAKQWNIEKVFQEHMKSTGYALLIDGKTGETLEMIQSGSANLFFFDSWFSDDPEQTHQRNIKAIKKHLKK